MTLLQFYRRLISPLFHFQNFRNQSQLKEIRKFKETSLTSEIIAASEEWQGVEQRIGPSELISNQYLKKLSNIEMEHFARHCSSKYF